jgi:hypothetical protein
MDDKAYLRKLVAEWIADGDLTPDMDIEQAVNVLLGAFERSKAHVLTPIELPWWCQTFRHIMLEQEMQMRFTYLSGKYTSKLRTLN